MSRYSPTVRPYAGRGFDPETIARAIEGFQDDRRLEQERGQEAEDRSRRQEREDLELDWIREDRQYQQGERQRASARGDVEDFEAGIRTPEQMQRHLSPFRSEIERISATIRNPLAGAMPARSRLLEQQQAAVSRGAVDRAMEELRGSQPLAGGRRYLPNMSAGARTARAQAEQQQMMGEQAAQIAAGMGADEAQQQYFRLNPDALEDLLQHEWSMERDAARDSASMARTQASIAARETSRSEERGQMSPAQAYQQAREILRRHEPEDPFGRRFEGEEGLVQAVANALVEGRDIGRVISDWDFHHREPEPEPIPDEPGWLSRAWRGLRDAARSAPEARGPRGAQQMDPRSSVVDYDPADAVIPPEYLDFTDEELAEAGFTPAEIAASRAR